MNQVTVIIVNYNAGSMLRRCLESLFLQEFKGLSIIVVDNGSTDGSLKDLTGLDPRLSLIELGENLGFAAACNAGARNASTSWIATLNPDTEARPDWLTKLMEAAERHSDVSMFGSLQLMRSDPKVVDGAGDCYHFLGLPWRGGFGWKAADIPSGTYEIFSPCAAAALYRREPFMHAGGFDERFFCCVEDMDLGFRLRLQGERALQVNDAVILHESAATIGRRSDFAAYYGSRNRLLCYIKNMPGVFFWPMLPFHLGAQSLLLALALSCGVLLPSLRGLEDAFWQLPAVWKERKIIQASRKIAPFALWKRFSHSFTDFIRRAPSFR